MEVFFALRYNPNNGKRYVQLCLGDQTQATYSGPTTFLIRSFPIIMIDAVRWGTTPILSQVWDRLMVCRRQPNIPAEYNGDRNVQYIAMSSSSFALIELLKRSLRSA